MGVRLSHARQELRPPGRVPFSHVDRSELDELVDWFAGQIVFLVAELRAAQGRGIAHEGLANEAYQLAETPMIRVRGVHGHDPKRK